MGGYPNVSAYPVLFCLDRIGLDVLPYLVCTQCYFLCVFVSDVKYVYVTRSLIHL